MNWYVPLKKNKAKLQIIGMSKFHENLHDIVVEVAKDNNEGYKKYQGKKKTYSTFRYCKQSNLKVEKM